MRPLETLTKDGAYMLFVREKGVFRREECRGYRDEAAAYSFLESQPDLWKSALERGSCQVPVEGFLDGRDVWVAVDSVSSPACLLAAEIPRKAGADVGAVLRLLLALNAVAAKNITGRAGAEQVSESMPAWLADLAGKAQKLSSPILVASEPGSGSFEFVEAFLRARFGPNRQAVFFSPSGLSEAVQLREFFGDSAGARLGGAGAVLPMTDRPGDAIVIQEAADLSRQVQLRLLALFASEQNNRFWIFVTSRNLQDMSAAGEFLSGLLKFFEKSQIVLPPVRACRERLPEEIQRLLSLLREKYRRDIRVQSSALERMISYDWPGNWVELQNTLESAFLLCKSSQIEVSDLKPDLTSELNFFGDLNLRRQALELGKNLILRAYALHGGNQVQMAKALGISRGSLQYKMEKYGLS